MRKFSLLLLCVLAVPLFAGITGKIVGRVYDSNTGEPLPGVNVIIEGTTMGAATDPDGYFVILNVPPATYEVTARMMGYRFMTITDTKIEADLTQTLEFPLKSTAIAVKGVVVKAKRPIIKKDVTTSVAIISSEDMEFTPVNTVQGVVARQAGVIDAGGLHVRGGRNTEIIYVVNGVQMTDPLSGGFDSHIPQEAVEQTSVYTGGFGAEYGSAQSGVINVITKSGGPKFHFTLRVRDNDAFGLEGIQSFLDENEAYDTTYLAAITSDSVTPYIYISPDWKDTSYYEKPFDIVPITQVSGKVDSIAVKDTLTGQAWRPEKMKRIDFTLSGPLVGEKLRFFLGGEFNTDEGHQPHADNTLQSYTGKLTFKPFKAFKIVAHGLYSTNSSKTGGYNNWLSTDMQWKFFPQGHRDHYEYSYEYGLNITHAITPEIIQEFRFNNYTTSLKYDIFEDGSYDLNGDGVIDENDKDGIDDFTDGNNNRIVEINGEEKGFKWPELQIYPFNRTANYDGYYYMGYPRVGYGYDKKETYTAKWDLTAQIGRIHGVKAGLSGEKFVLFDYGADMASGGNVYMDWTEAKPYRIAGYIQDKIEQETFVLNAGLRFDYFSANSNNEPSDRYNPVTDITSGGEIKDPISAEPQWSISPRVGFSFPIAEYDKFHFTYGHYFQMPPMMYMYRNQNYDFSGAFPMVGNPSISPEKTVSYEAGVEHAFNDQILLDITAYMKDISGLTDTQQIFYSMVNYYTKYSNSDYGHSKGVEINFSKRRGGTPAWLTWNINYTFCVARGKSSSTRQNYDYIWAGYVVPAEEHYLNWDQRHTVTADIGFHAPEGERLFGIPGLSNTGVDFTTNYGSGLPWTPPSRTREQLINTGRRPHTIQTDVRFYKNWEVGQLEVGLFGDVYHIFNVKNLLYIADVSWYNAYGDPRGAYKDPNVYSARRFMRIGLLMKW